MKAHVVNIDIASRSDCFFIRGFFCVHVGNVGCDIEGLKKDIEEVRRRPNCFAFIGGDVADSINISDKRFDIKSLSKEYHAELDGLAQKQGDSVVDLFMPIKDKLLFSLTGNHEETIRKRYHFNIADYVATRLDIPLLGYSALVRVTINRQKGKSKKPSNKNIILFVHHGFGGGRKIGGKINNAIDNVAKCEADIYWVGHVHDRADVTIPRLNITKSGIPRLIDNEKLYIIGGTYLKTYQENTTGYGEVAGYMPTKLGSAVIKIVPFSVTSAGKGEQMELPVQYRVVDLEDMEK